MAQAVEAELGTAGGRDCWLPCSTVPAVAAQPAAHGGHEQQPVGVVVPEPLKMQCELVGDDGRQRMVRQLSDVFNEPRASPGLVA